MTLSICICSLHKRDHFLQAMLLNLNEQIDRLNVADKVEILLEIDGGELTTGAKRNMLYHRAKGKYVCCVDDDDDLPVYYIEEMLRAAAQDKDAIAINGTMTTDGKRECQWFISRLNPYLRQNRRGKIVYLRFHNHLSPVKRDIALRFPFPNKVKGEDYAYALALHRARAIKTETIITKPMYHYRYLSNKE